MGVFKCIKTVFFPKAPETLHGYFKKQEKMVLDNSQIL
jgi:hypothetical protein